MFTGCKPLLTLAFAVLVGLATGVGCKGFFVNQPTSVTVSPASGSLTSGQQQAFTALAAFSDNTSKDVTTNATWSTSSSCIVAIITSGANGGHATAVGSGGSATITASYNGVVGTATASVATGLTLSPCPQQVVGNYPEVVFNVGQSATFTASGASGTITWTSDNTSVANFASSSSGTATFPSAGTATITATTSTETGTLFITVQ
jgi:uncharacterized protein YjdB